MIYNFYIFNRSGACLFYEEWNKSSDAMTLSDAEEEKRLMFGLIFSLKEFLRKMSPPSSTPQTHALKTFKTDVYTCHHLETLSGLRFILTTDNASGDLQDALQHIYANLYVELVTKNPVHDAKSTKSIKCKFFRTSVIQPILYFHLDTHTLLNRTMPPSRPPRPTFYNDTRNYGGRVAVYDELINHQMKLLSINPSGTTTKPGIVSLRRKRPPASAGPSELSMRLSRNRKSVESAAVTDHRIQVKVLMHKILNYSKKQSIDNVQTKRLVSAPATHRRFNVPLKDGFGIQRQIDAPIHDEAKRRLHAIHYFNEADIHNDNVGIRSLRNVPVKSPRLRTTNQVKVLLLTLQLHLSEQRQNVLEFFGTADSGGDGSISVSKLRSILFHLDLGWTQHDISLVVKAVDPEESGIVLPITLETLLRKLQQPPLGSPSIAPSPLTRSHSASLYGKRMQDLRKAFASPRVQPVLPPNQ
ncbi:unnamed protein product [Aphanomyces euteiches]|uniref:Trafficking protein particle complex subunit n=1 Tax=Aphanomyces euteiches TaxID=100861 RepID=A0A6G0X1W3_9STRA|nr:hypothetical protein Ae201684_009377 [Aphanomyces euteiches]KAH9069950.1 hypothetical protein Ae201684P_002324 [Aphanomyces euteiches]KAH9155390.1 hypothetical protein AeRB84_002622 [Aphanomyces euteiches]